MNPFIISNLQWSKSHLRCEDSIPPPLLSKNAFTPTLFLEVIMNMRCDLSKYNCRTIWLELGIELILNRNTSYAVKHILPNFKSLPNIHTKSLLVCQPLWIFFFISKLHSKKATSIQEVYKPLIGEEQKQIPHHLFEISNITYLTKCDTIP